MNKCVNNINRFVEISKSNNASYNERMNALENITDMELLNDIANNAADDWIRLEAAIKANLNGVLLNLYFDSKIERIKLEAAIVMEDQKKLSEITISGSDYLSKKIALNSITKKQYLPGIINESNNEKIKVEAAIKLGNKEILRRLFYNIENDNQKLKIATYIGDIQYLKELALNSNEPNIARDAANRIKDLNGGID